MSNTNAHTLSFSRIKADWISYDAKKSSLYVEVFYHMDEENRNFGSLDFIQSNEYPHGFWMISEDTLCAFGLDELWIDPPKFHNLTTARNFLCSWSGRWS